MASDTLQAESASANPYETAPFQSACRMEEPLAAINDLMTALGYLVEGVEDQPLACAVARIAFIARDQCASAEKLRVEIFRAAHPNPEGLVRR